MVNKQMVHGIEWGGWHWVTSGQKHATINYYFAGAHEDVAEDNGWTSVEKAAFKHALGAWANVAGIDFKQVNNRANATFIEHSVDGSFFGSTPGSVVLGFHQTPDGGAPVHGVFSDDAGFGWDRYNADGGLQKGGFGFVTLVHEIGHGLGLAHPHDNGGGSPVWPGVSSAGDTGSHQLNQDINTVMSYVSGVTTKPLNGAAMSDTYGNVAGPMAFDIAAIQELYGARPHHGGNSTYKLPDANAAGTYFSCIWDSGGTDRIIYDGDRNIVIDLGAATLNNAKNGGGALSQAKGIFGGFTIAHGVKIENAHGGSGNDRIAGNNSHNKLHGNDGHDRLFGRGGQDQIHGGRDGDRIDPGRGHDKVWGNGGADRFVFKSQYGTNHVQDFKDGKDRIDLIKFHFNSNWQALKHFSDGHGPHDGMVVFHDSDTKVKVHGVDLHDFNGHDLLI